VNCEAERRVEMEGGVEIVEGLKGDRKSCILWYILFYFCLLLALLERNITEKELQIQVGGRKKTFLYKGRKIIYLFLLNKQYSSFKLIKYIDVIKKMANYINYTFDYI
jgi:hypothetical protein